MMINVLIQLLLAGRVRSLELFVVVTKPTHGLKNEKGDEVRILYQKCDRWHFAILGFVFRVCLHMAVAKGMVSGRCCRMRAIDLMLVKSYIVHDRVRSGIVEMTTIRILIFLILHTPSTIVMHDHHHYPQNNNHALVRCHYTNPPTKPTERTTTKSSTTTTTFSVLWASYIR